MRIVTRINTSDDLILLFLVIDTIDKSWNNSIDVYMPYMPYQQADRDFGEGECFSLRTICNIFNNLPVRNFIIFDAHSDITPALLKRTTIVDNSAFIQATFNMLGATNNDWTPDKNLVILSPDAGAYKKIFKLCEKLGFKGEIENANKYRDTTDGSLKIRLSREDFGGKDILIIDDICIGGRTFIDLANSLNDRSVGRLYLAVSHGIFSNGTQELGKYFQTIFTTNSRSNDYRILEANYHNTNMYEVGYNPNFHIHAFEVI